MTLLDIHRVTGQFCSIDQLKWWMSENVRPFKRLAQACIVKSIMIKNDSRRSRKLTEVTSSGVDCAGTQLGKYLYRATACHAISEWLTGVFEFIPTRKGTRETPTVWYCLYCFPLFFVWLYCLCTFNEIPSPKNAAWGMVKRCRESMTLRQE